jgi:hypothetical protein
MVYQMKTSLKINSMIGLLIGSLGIGAILPGCQRNLSQDSKASVYVVAQAEQGSPKTLTKSPHFQVLTAKSNGVLSESLIYGSSAPGGLKNATLKITMGSSLKQLNNFHLSLSLPGELEQEMSVTCQNKNCRLTTNTLRNPQLVKYALTHHLKRVISEMKDSASKAPMSKTPGLSLFDSRLPEAFQLGLIGLGVLVLVGFVIGVVYTCSKLLRSYTSNRGRIQNDLEMAVREAHLPENVTQTIARRATILVVDPDGRMMVGQGDPEAEVLPANAQNADIIRLYWAVVGEG